MILPNDFINGQNADAVPIEQNYQLIESYVNNELVNRDGSVAMSQPLLLSGDPSAANHAVNKDYVDAKVVADKAYTDAAVALKVSKAGDTITGPLNFKIPTDDPIRLYKNAAATYTYMAFMDEDQLTRRGWVGIDPNDDMYLVSDTGTAVIVANGSGKTVRLVGVSGTEIDNGVNIRSTGPGGYGLNVASGPNYIHGGLNVYDGLNIASAGAGGYCLNVAAGPNYLHGGLAMDGGFSQASGAFTVNSGTDNWIQFAAGGSGSVTLTAGPSGSIGLNSGVATLFYNGGIEFGRVYGGYFLWGKTSSNGYVQGVEVAAGRVESTTSDRNNFSCRHIGGVDVVNAGFIGFFAGTAASGNDILMSEIRQNGSRNGVLFPNCVATAPSDYRWKDDLGPVTGALDRVMQLQPKRLAWKASGEEFEGFIAHEADPVVPYLVVGEKDAVTDNGAIEGQGIDYGGLTTLLTAAMQELAERVTALEDA